MNFLLKEQEENQNKPRFSPSNIQSVVKEAIESKGIIRSYVYNRVTNKYGLFVNRLKSDLESKAININNINENNWLEQIVVLAKNGQLQNEQLGSIDKFSLRLIILGYAQIFASLKTLFIITRMNLQESSFDLTIRILNKVKEPTIKEKFQNRPVLFIAGVVTTLASGIVLISTGFGLLRNEALKARLNLILKRERNILTDLVNAILNHEKLKDSKLIMLIRSKIKSAIAIKNLISAIKRYTVSLFKKPQNESTYVLQESIATALVGILSKILVVGGVGFVLSVGFVFVSELTGTNYLERLANSDSPFAPFFRRIKQIFNKADSEIEQAVKEDQQ